jgi:antibiotic biosynthesis monooxygenase (ABM) superfamily enzyme
MKRRTYLAGLMAAATTGVTQAQTKADAKASAAKPGAAKGRPIQLHLDLLVDPKREQEMLTIFEKTFRPTAARQPGYIDLKMLKLSSAIRGEAPKGGKYRFVLTFESEALRQKWIASKDHERVWPEIEKTLVDKNFGILLYDVY